MNNIYINKISKSDNIPYDLLLLADPSKQQIDSYIDRNMIYLVKNNPQEIIGVTALKKLSSEIIEIKNIAIKPNFQGLGIGKKLLHYITNLSKKMNYRKIRIGTGNSSINQLALYQKVGFDIVDIDKDFFLKNYDDIIIENNIQCKHLIIFEKNLD